MKIVINEQKVGDLNGGVVFETDIYHTSVTPKITFWKNMDDIITLNLHLWDSKEITDGYTTEQTKELITTLRCAVEFAENVKVKDDNTQMNLFDIGE
jgi:hypothetical protein